MARAQAMPAGDRAVGCCSSARASARVRDPLSADHAPGPVAKGVEDTAFYRYARLLALNDVGGCRAPGGFGISAGRRPFMPPTCDRAKRFPQAMLTTTTHDTKRTADVRARIAALTWIPADWEEHVRRWLEPDRAAALERLGAPDDVERYFLVPGPCAGAWPIELDANPEAIDGEGAARGQAQQQLGRSQPSGSGNATCSTLRPAPVLDHKSFLADFEPFVRMSSRLGDRGGARACWR